jgi:hypothetical protein
LERGKGSPADRTDGNGARAVGKGSGVGLTSADGNGALGVENGSGFAFGFAEGNGAGAGCAEGNGSAGRFCFGGGRGMDSPCGLDFRVPCARSADLEEGKSFCTPDIPSIGRFCFDEGAPAAVGPNCTRVGLGARSPLAGM